VRAACSDHETEVTFYEVVDTGLSTVDPAHASELRANGWNVVETAVQVVTLDSLLEKHELGPIHFLKVDVEGWESAVLAGCDLRRWRPWVLVIEATAPLSRELTSAGWEPSILDAGYRQVYFDGLNNYYVADEHAELAADFGLQPNVFDGFALAPDHCLVDQTQRLALLQEIEHLRDLVTQTEELARSCEEWARTSEAQLMEYQDYAAQAIKKARKAAEINHRSIAWQLAQPVRKGSRRIRRGSVSVVKSAARPALDLGLTLVRRNEGIKSRLWQVLHRVPAVEARLRKYADARPATREAE
jgi:hypothetical protein